MIPDACSVYALTNDSVTLQHHRVKEVSRHRHVCCCMWSTRKYKDIHNALTLSTKSNSNNLVCSLLFPLGNRLINSLVKIFYPWLTVICLCSVVNWWLAGLLCNEVNRLTGILHFNRLTSNQLKLFCLNRGSTS